MKYLSLLSFAALAAPLAHAADKDKSGWGWLVYALNDPATHVVFIALIIFLGFMWWVGAFKFVGKKLDERGDAIAKELEEAKSLREQAAEALALAERKQQDADKEAEAIITRAKEDADLMLKEARQDLADRLARREAMAEARIARAEAEAAEDVRRAAADAATEAARKLLASDSSVDQFEAAAAEIERAL